MRSINLTPGKAICIAALGLVASGFALGVALAGGFNDDENFYVEAYNQSNLIRFHVIANSDSVKDQALKRRVRDLIVQQMTPKFELARDVNDARKVAADNLEFMEAIAQKEVLRWGKNYGVKAVLGRFTFPEKTYGNITLPKGEYEAVRVILGEGAGANWWCVLFPPLCFIDGSREMPVETLPEEMSVKPETAKKSRKQEDRLQDTEIRVQFKLVELFKKKFMNTEAAGNY